MNCRQLRSLLAEYPDDAPVGIIINGYLYYGDIRIVEDVTDVIASTSYQTIHPVYLVDGR